MVQSLKVVVIGGGISGLIAAHELQRKGHRVVVFEKNDQLRGIERWPGEQIHSHNYRTPEPFRDQVVVIIGNGPSAHDISIEISEVAKEIHLASRFTNLKVRKLDNRENLWQHPMIEYVYEDNKVVFHDGSYVYADVIFHCTGYKYHFPFLKESGVVSVEDNRVGHLYKHVFPPCVAPFLSFAGIPTKVFPFWTYELQSKWVAQVLSGKVLLPSEEEMMVLVEEFYQHMNEIGRPKHHTHEFNLDKGVIEYNNWLAAQVGSPPVEEWIEHLCVMTISFIVSHHDSFRDEWDEDYWIQQSHSASQRLL